MLSMLVLHSAPLVTFGSGYAVGSQAVLIFSSQVWREEMMDLSLVAPTFVLFPPHDRSEALPPPTSITLLAIGPNRPFLPDFLPPVLLYLDILFCCIKKLVTLELTIFNSFTAVSRQVEFTALEHAVLFSPAGWILPLFLWVLAFVFCFVLGFFAFLPFFFGLLLLLFRFLPLLFCPLLLFAFLFPCLFLFLFLVLLIFPFPLFVLLPLLLLFAFLFPHSLLVFFPLDFPLLVLFFFAFPFPFFFLFYLFSFLDLHLSLFLKFLGFHPHPLLIHQVLLVLPMFPKYLHLMLLPALWFVHPLDLLKLPVLQNLEGQEEMCFSCLQDGLQSDGVDVIEIGVDLPMYSALAH